MHTRHGIAVRLSWMALALFATGCLDRELKPLNPCLVSGVTRQVKITYVDKVDLLFMVDNSNSMAGEQASLREQFPRVVQVLTTGQRTDDTETFPPVKDLHVGVVSSDMGIPGVNGFRNCSPDGGDDGRLLNTPHPNASVGVACDGDYSQAKWLSYTTGQDSARFANDVGCIANLGTEGCGYEEQLESPFKALWPSAASILGPDGTQIANPYHFISTSEEGLLGRGDRDNQGFLRNDPAQGLSLIAIVLVTDEEDCSVYSTDHLKPPELLDDSSPYKDQPINLRCYYNKQFLYDVKERYLKGFRLLRPGNEDLVVFAAIAGVPEYLVRKADLPDFTDDVARDQWFDKILYSDEMQERVDTSLQTEDQQVVPSCSRQIEGTSELSYAYPPRRIVELAKAFGKNGIVQSICQDDFSTAMEAIIGLIADRLSEVCLPRPLVRQSNDKVSCNVVWELPKVAPAGGNTPISCDERSFLEPVAAGSPTTNAAGGNNCKVAQLPVHNQQLPSGDGWYYDDFSADLAQTCNRTPAQRVAFTTSAIPPSGVTVKLECLNETQKVTETVPNSQPNQPEIGSECGDSVSDASAADCVVKLNDGATDTRLFCHPSLNTCVRSCASDPDCPAAWVCDLSQERPFCVNPTCGAGTEFD
jgi:hypothetical protein